MSDTSGECIGKDVRPDFEINDCKNMRPVPGDTDMDCERYKCEVCGKRDSLYYDEMR